ncbi:uncharacterized protein LAESUDRAFT_693192, partial [Laetiporus sulphureus 93-53]
MVFDFKQHLKCICGFDNSDRAIGPVTAVALSFDHMFVASGHASGHIQLFDLKTPKAPVRFVVPTTLDAVASGRQEGHLAGSRIVSVGFIAGRHTALVSADDSGLAFYHSLGKVFFMDASDTLRLLGKYPDEELPTASTSHHFRRRKTRKASTILATGPLPLGTASHPTDQYNLVALLTPIKLVIVGLKPSPRTWYRCHRESDDVSIKSRFKGTLAWYPSIVKDDGSYAEINDKKAKAKCSTQSSSTPMLIYSWGDTLYLMRVFESKVSQQVRNKRTGKVDTAEVGIVTFEEAGKWTVDGDILALQWLNVNQVIVLTLTNLEVYDVRSTKLVERVPYDAWTLVSPTLSHTTNGSVSYPDAVTEVAHSMRVYKGKIFMLGQHELQVGTLLTWADRILAFVEKGDFLSAIELTRAYYVGETSSNKNGLPESTEKLKDVVGEKMRELMRASADYAFSEDRMIDETHVTLDGRGVDRTSLFEGLVRTCARACIALDDYEYLFEDLFQYYDDNGIARIFLLQLEPFILERKIHQVPPRITQRLVAMHEENNQPDFVERVIWHIDPDCLDVNQAITLCQKHHLYDALIYVYNRALKDYVSPLVELIGLVRKVQQYRKTRREGSPVPVNAGDEAIEPVVLNAYKVYSYLADVLTGLAYPSAEPLPEEESLQAKKDVYTFLFNGRSSVRPIENGEELILTADEENGVEPTYPYTRLLLRFDPEAFLHTLDLAFEDAFFNDKTRAVNRLVIVKILLEILSSPALPHTEFTFINVFLARNIPKYPQFIQIPPSALHNILISLAEDPDSATREDRQLAAEYLLSAYTPHESERLAALFEKAGFYRILRSWYRQERQWTPLLKTYLHDPDLSRSDLSPYISDVLVMVERAHKGTLPTEVANTVVRSLPSLLSSSVMNTAALLDQHLPTMHESAFALLDSRSEEDRHAYLQYLLGPPTEGESCCFVPFRRGGPSPHVPPALRQIYISLCCHLDPSSVIPAIRYLPSNFVDVTTVVQICEEHEVYDAAVWMLSHSGDAMAALAKAEAYESSLSARLGDALSQPHPGSESTVTSTLSMIQAIGEAAIAMCLEQLQKSVIPVEEVWFQLLRCQIDAVQRVASVCSSGFPDAHQDNSENREFLELQQRTISSLRSLVQQSFSSLMSINSAKEVSLPRLFKRLITSASQSNVAKPALYAEFRTLFTGMLDTYRSDTDMLVITKHLVDDDLFATIEMLAQQRARGWPALQGICRSCGKPFLDTVSTPENNTGSSDGVPIIVSRTGEIYHSTCATAEHPNTISVH